MKTAPATHYLIALPSYLKSLCWLYLVVTCLAILVFVVQQLDNPALQLERIVGLSLICLLSVVATVHYIKTYLTGRLHYTGQNWQVHRFNSSHSALVLEPVFVTCILDLRSKMVLQIKIAKHKKYWVIIEYIQEPTQWLAIRRAILDSAH